MIYAINADAELDALLDSWLDGSSHLMHCFNGWSDPRYPLHYFADNADSPRIVLGGAGGSFVILGDYRLTTQVVNDLFNGNINLPNAWPDKKTCELWNDEKSTPYMSMNTVGVEAQAVFSEMGFIEGKDDFDPDGDTRDGGYFYIVKGEPYLSEYIAHSCRVVEGLELFELMKRAVTYDGEGTYIKRCLTEGPSFVCEADGEPVCWSCTHANRAMGMIYTPEEHRRNGYGRSLAAFQTDHMLRVDGVAFAVVLATNTPSQRMCDSLSIPRIANPAVWRTYYFPDGWLAKHGISG